MATFKLALSAGHYLNESGKRVPLTLDPRDIREWTLNDRIADRVESLLKNRYTGCEVLRLDDTTGQQEVGLTSRTNKANAFGADLYLAIHHNAGISGGSGGGIMAIVYTTPSTASLEWQKALYEELVSATGLQGDRAEPMPRMNLHEVRESNMPAVLLELGFMDSTTDVPIITSDAYADKCAGAIARVIAEKANLSNGAGEETGTLYRVQVGAFAQRENAEALLARLQAAGFPDAYIRTE